MRTTDLNHDLAEASAGVLRTLAEAFRSGRLAASVSRLTLNRVCPCPDSLIEELTALTAQGMIPAHMALLLDARAEAVEGRMSGALPIELVWTGPGKTHTRDTSVVVRELFAGAQRSVLVSTFIVRNAEFVFEPLAHRMDEVPTLTARVFLDIKRDGRDKRHESELLRKSADEFRRAWPGRRHPEVYYDPRALAAESADRATWHAKCVIVDDEIAFVTSANFTERAHLSNVEAGVLVRDRTFAIQLRAQFEDVVQAGRVNRLPGF